MDMDIIYYKINNTWVEKNIFKNALIEKKINYSNYKSLIGMVDCCPQETIESVAPYAILQKPVTMEQIKSIVRVYIGDKPTTPLDCVVSALQILGNIDNNCALFIREITKDTGIGNIALANLLSYAYGRKCDLIPITNFNELTSILDKSLRKGNLCVCGWHYEGFAHTFVIAMNEGTGKKYVLDPQIQDGINDYDTFFSMMIEEATSEAIRDRVNILWIVAYDVESISK